ncbi:hypothetical protein HMPREF1705_04684 [Acetomicrobium hydrogeniformans ATCC BAA-1850]|uniref:Uncharacterized protein n=1 Tax=Acetomicrobium hydrogeniformans ATCC BAA-1850 TaxID=592015 RepID=A0A0T5X7Z9_9BACT|nr:hypothetical protein HMPREF1705_04684 [Acetomicrobium hydrogeniformans ATCC BAA-1850]
MYKLFYRALSKKLQIVRASFNGYESRYNQNTLASCGIEHCQIDFKIT